MIFLSLTGCSASDADLLADAEQNGDEVMFTVTAPDRDGHDYTRTVSTPVDGINEFYVYAYQGKTRKANNVKYAWNGTIWKAAGTGVVWPSTDAINIYGLTDSYKKVLKDNMQASRSINYYIDPANPHDVWYASAVNQTKAKTNGTVNLKFTRLVSRVNLSCKNSMTNYAVKISELIIHNIVSAGTFTFSETSASAGTWKLLNTGDNPYYADYPQKLKLNEANRDDALPVVFPKATNQLVTDSAYILIPQKTVKWTPDKEGGKDTAYARVNHQCYIEVKCQIFHVEDNVTTINPADCVHGDVAGADDDAKYVSIFIPFLKTWSKNNNVQNMVFDLGDAYFADGSKWTPNNTDVILFDEGMLMTPIEDDSGNVDLWDEGEDDDSDAIPVEL